MFEIKDLHRCDLASDSCTRVALKKGNYVEHNMNPLLEGCPSNISRSILPM